LGHKRVVEVGQFGVIFLHLTESFYELKKRPTNDCQFEHKQSVEPVVKYILAVEGNNGNYFTN
jgi:hypothetical protein